MWKRKGEKTASGSKSYEEELKERMEEQFKEGKRKDDSSKDKSESKESDDDDEKSEEKRDVSKEKSEEKEAKKEKKEKKEAKIDETKMSLDEIEEIRKKREKFKEKQKKSDDKKDKSEEKEEGEVNSDDERRAEKKAKRNYRRKSRSKSRSRSRDKPSRSNHDTRKRSHSRSRSTHRSSYQSSRQSFKRSRSRDHQRQRRSRSRSRDRYFTSFRSSRDGRSYRDRDQDRNRDRDRDRHRERDRDRDRDYNRSSRRRSRSRSRDKRDSFRGSRSEIDKAKLLAIAKKNAVKLLSSDNLMGMDHDRLIAIKSGGQNLRQLTDFCRELASKGITDEFDDDDDLLYGGKAEDVHHPFEVKERAIPNPYSSAGVSGEKLTPAMKSAAMSHRMIEFPVSSGNAHRVTEDHVDPAAELAKKKEEAKPEVKPEETPVKPEIKEAKEPEETEAQKANAENPLGVIMFGGVPEKPKELTFEPSSVVFEEPKREVSESKEEVKDSGVFDPVAEPSKDITSIVSQRLGAMKKLNDNPTDPQALKELYDAQKEMSKWATSKNKPGQFTGHTGAKILTHAELSTGIQAWAKQEQFTKAQKVQGGFGEYLLKKMGWSEGDGLGKTRSGDVDPLTLDIKMDKKGLMSAEEGVKKRGGRSKDDIMTLTACKDLSHKHPVSGLMELATKRKWGPPNFVQIFEIGPPHKKQYIFKVTVAGQEFQPTIASENKKKAKADAACVALQELGLLPKDPNNPL